MSIEHVEREADRHHDLLMAPQVSVIVKAVRDDPNYKQCPRCRHYHTVLLNFDYLCDRCCHSIIEGWPEHASVPFIQASWEAQRRHFSRPMEGIE
jgi:hypothetical protein